MSIPGRSTIVAFKSTDFKGHFHTLQEIIGMNIQFNYQYRDGGNYKNYKEIVFINPGNRSVQELRDLIENRLIDGQWFYCEEWLIPDLHFKEFGYDPTIDVDWHEFVSIEETERSATESNTIEDLLALTKSTKLPY